MMQQRSDSWSDEIILHKGDKVTFEGIDDDTLLQVTARKYNYMPPMVLVTNHTENGNCLCPECVKEES